METKEFQLRQKTDELNEQWNLISKKLQAIETKKILENRPEEIFRLDKESADLQAKRREIEQTLDNLKNQFDNLPPEPIVRPAKGKLKKIFYLASGLLFVGWLIVYGILHTMEVPANTIPSHISIIEAEQCRTEGYCGYRGQWWWRNWGDKGASNNLLISNELALIPDANKRTNEIIQKSLEFLFYIRSNLFITFEGNGIVLIIYRQDSWYKELTVMIDGYEKRPVIQGGIIKSQVEACYNVTGTGHHNVVLMASRMTGVVTIDAIKIIRGEGATCPN